MEEFCFEITEELEDERVDKCLALLMDTLSRSYIQKMVKEGQVTVNGRPVRGSFRLKADDRVVFSLPAAQEPDILPENIPLDILYEDSDVIVVNKPKGMVVHPAAGHYSGTLVNALLYHCGGELSGINGVLRPGIVHRIDRDTTGSVIACKNDRAHRIIAQQLKEHSVTRRYQAICCGALKEDEGVVDRPIGRHPADRKKMAVNERNGKRAVTHYQVLERFDKYTFLECRRRGVPIRSGCIWRLWGILCWGTRCTETGNAPSACRDRLFTPGLWALFIHPRENMWRWTRRFRLIFWNFCEK